MSDDEVAYKAAYNAGLAALSRRDYAKVELQRKLAAKGLAAEAITNALEKLQEQHYLDESRFVENFIQTRCNQGYGPQRIRQELRHRGIDEDLITTALEQQTVDWWQQAHQVREKRFGQQLPESMQERAKQMRFLSYRGFSSEQIRAVLSED